MFTDKRFITRTDYEATVQRILESFRATGGVTPANATSRNVQRLLERASVAGAQEITKALTSLCAEARECGLVLTVNDLTPLLYAFLGRYDAYVQGEVPLFPPLYKGVSYNPAGGNWREWIVLLDFFALMRRIAKQYSAPPVQLAVLDALAYWVVNLLGEQGISLTSPSAEVAATKLVQFLERTLQEQQPTAEVYGIARMRNAYLRAIAEQFPAGVVPQVFTVADVWRDSGYAEFLALALQSFCSYSGGRWVVSRAVTYERYMMYSPWVTPLVAVEQTYLAAKCGFRLFLAPTQEAAWNSAVDTMSRLTRTPRYATLLYLRPAAGGISYADFPFFADDADAVARKLRQNPQLLPLVAALVKPFLSDTMTFRLNEAVDCGSVDKAAEEVTMFTGAVDRRARELATVAVPPVSLSAVNWLMAFAPGSC